MIDFGSQLKRAADLNRLEKIADERAELLGKLDSLNAERGELIRALRDQGVTVKEIIKHSRLARERVYEAIRGQHRTPTGAGRRPTKGA